MLLKRGRGKEGTYVLFLSFVLDLLATTMLRVATVICSATRSQTDIRLGGSGVRGVKCQTSCLIDCLSSTQYCQYVARMV